MLSGSSRTRSFQLPISSNMLISRLRPRMVQIVTQNDGTGRSLLARLQHLSGERVTSQCRVGAERIRDETGERRQFIIQPRKRSAIRSCASHRNKVHPWCVCTGRARLPSIPEPPTQVARIQSSCGTRRRTAGFATIHSGTKHTFSRPPGSPGRDALLQSSVLPWKSLLIIRVSVFERGIVPAHSDRRHPHSQTRPCIKKTKFRHGCERKLFLHRPPQRAGQSDQSAHSELSISSTQYLVESHQITQPGEPNTDQLLLRGVKRPLGNQDAQIAVNPSFVPGFGKPIGLLQRIDE
jgi:hypothetical protein